MMGREAGKNKERNARHNNTRCFVVEIVNDWEIKHLLVDFFSVG
jgi:hypothetical protein